MTRSIVVTTGQPVADPSGVIVERTHEVVVILYEQIAGLVIEDQKALKRASGANYVGGGIGLTGAAEGMAMAAAMRAMTGAFTRRGTIIGVETSKGFFVADHVGSVPW